MKIRKSLILIIALALALRLIYFRGALTFFYDQARDALSAMEIFQEDPIKIIGPTSDFQGLHHGPLYWYLIGPIYHITNGNVWIVRFFLVLINIVTIFFVYDLARLLFKNTKIALLAGFLFAISFEATQYARWLSNPGPALLTSTVSFWSLYKLIKGKSWALITLLVSWGLSIQFQLFMLYQITVFAIIWISLKGLKLPKASLKTYVFAILGFLLTVSTYIAAELKFNFQSTKALTTFFKTQTLFGESFIPMFETYLERLVNTFFYNFWGVNLFVAGIATIATFYLAFKHIEKGKQKVEMLFLILWVFSPIIINLFTGPNATYITLGTLVGAAILTSFLLYKLKSKSRFLFFFLSFLVIVGNLNLILTKNKEGEVLFTVQKQMILGDELKIIDWIYSEAEGRPFKLNTITSPLFINTTWAHLFSWYGKEIYGHMPIWWGEPQVDVPGADIAFADESRTDLHFLIIEPTSTGDDNFIKAIKFLENERSEVEKSEEFGFFTVEKRIIRENKTFTSADVFHLLKNTDLKIIQAVE